MQDDLFRKQKKKEFLIVLMLCMVCVSAAIWGAAAFSKGNKTKEPSPENQIVDLNETTNTASNSKSQADNQEEATSEAPQNEVVNSQVTKPNLSVRPMYETPSEQNNSDKPANNTANTTPAASEEEPTAAPQNISANTPASNLTFSDSSVLNWPIQGSVILEYNMENTIYFPTLDSYRCNPAMVIQGDLGMEVHSAANGYVKEVGNNEEIGNYLVVALGNDYELTYGQLDNITVAQGDYIETSQTIACIAEPSNYYLREGRNLYFKLTKSGTPADPLDYLQ